MEFSFQPLCLSPCPEQLAGAVGSVQPHRHCPAAGTCSPASLWAAPSAQALWGTRCFFLVIFLAAKNSGNLWISYLISSFSRASVPQQQVSSSIAL